VPALLERPARSTCRQLRTATGGVRSRTRRSSGSCHGDPRRRQRIRPSRARARRASGRLLQCQWLPPSDRVAAGCSCKPNRAVIPRSGVSRTTRRKRRCTPIVMRSARKTSGPTVATPPRQRPPPGVSVVEWRRRSPTGIHQRRTTRRLHSPFGRRTAGERIGDRPPLRRRLRRPLLATHDRRSAHPRRTAVAMPPVAARGLARRASSRRGASELPEASRRLATLAETLGSRPLRKPPSGRDWCPRS
jgi:hypothetical protein